MYNGTFVGAVAIKDADIIRLARKFKLDKEAQRRLEEAVMRLEKEEKDKTMHEIEKHLETSNATSKCVMRLLSFIMTGKKIPKAPEPKDQPDKPEKDRNGDREARKRGSDRRRDDSRRRDASRDRRRQRERSSRRADSRERRSPGGARRHD